MPSNFTTPVGRLVQGSLYEPNTKDAEGRPLLVKSGPNTGKPRVEYFIALAIPKTPGQHWATSAWGAEIWKAGHAFMANAGNMGKNFAWKVRDGDSIEPNKRAKRPCDQEGFPGHWVVSFSSGFPPKIYSLVGVAEPQLLEQPQAVNLGDYVQINANVDGNASPQQPGVYINLAMVCLAGYGQRIVIGPDVASAGFGGQPLPAGASATPVGGFAPAAPPVPQAPGVLPPPLPQAGIAPMLAPPAPTALAPLVPLSVVPNPAFLAVPGAPMVPPPPTQQAALVPRPRVMLPAANGATYESLIGIGWTDVLLVQQGLMLG